MGDGWNPETSLVVKTTTRTNNNANAKLALISVVIPLIKTEINRTRFWCVVVAGHHLSRFILTH
jgi:hypothetical protein